MLPVDRKQFGQPIAELQLIQTMLADSRTEALAERAMVIETARKKDIGVNVATDAARCKLFCSESVGRVADRAVQIHGGAGSMAEYSVELFYREVRLFRSYEEPKYSTTHHRSKYDPECADAITAM